MAFSKLFFSWNFCGWTLSILVSGSEYGWVILTNIRVLHLDAKNVRSPFTNLSVNSWIENKVIQHSCLSMSQNFAKNWPLWWKVRITRRKPNKTNLEDITVIFKLVCSYDGFWVISVVCNFTKHNKSVCRENVTFFIFLGYSFPNQAFSVAINNHITSSNLSFQLLDGMVIQYFLYDWEIQKLASPPSRI